MDRTVLENEYLSLLINNPELITMVQIKPHHFLLENNKKLFTYIVEFYQKNNFLTATEINDGTLIDWYIELLDLPYKLGNPIKAMEYYELALDDLYKKNRLKDLYSQTLLSKVSYNQFLVQVNKIEEESLTIHDGILTKEELNSNLALAQKGIKFKKYSNLLEQLKLFENDLVVVGATTGVGKSAFLINLMNDLMDEYQCIYFNLEMSKANIYRRLVAVNGNVPVNCIDNPSPYQMELIEEAKEKIIKNEVQIIHQVNDVYELKKMIVKHKSKTKHTIIFLDHIGLIRGIKMKSLYESTTEVIKELRKICLNYDCTIIGASQLNRTAYSSEEISINMLKDSGELENSARKIILLSYQDKKDKENLEPIVDIDIAKNDSGLTGIVKMKYYKTKQVFEEVLIK